MPFRFSKRWEEYCKEYQANETDERLPYVVVGYFAHHLVELMEQGETEEFPMVFDAIEQLHLEGDDYVQELATIGLLESIQNAAGWRKVEEGSASPEAFVPYLHPETLRWWRGLDDFWEGRSPTVTPVD